MRIVITGASGNVGTALLRRLSAAGNYELIGLSRRRPPETAPYASARWVEADLGQPGVGEVLRKTFAGADAVVHLAWAIQPQRRPEVLHRVNQDGTQAVVHAAIAAEVPHLVHQSSIGAYAPGPGRTVDESWPTTGIRPSVYSVDKAAAERIVDAAEGGILVTRMRPALIFQNDAASEVARYFLGRLFPRVILRRGVLRYSPFPDALAFQLVHADDVAGALEIALRDRPGGALNVAAPPVIDRTSFREAFGGVAPPLPAGVVRAAAALAWRSRALPIEPGWVDLAAQVPRLDTGRLESLGWRANRDAREVLARFVDAIRRGTGSAGPLLYPISRNGRTAS